jgi:penicillin-binding protein 1C
MKRRKSILSITLIIVFVSMSLGLFFFHKPSLLTSLNYSTAVYGDNEQLLRLTLSSDDKYRLYTPLSKVAPVLIEATLLQEDQYFWNHVGINPVAMMKAAWQTYVRHSRRLGASTITMQVARLSFRLHSKTPWGKFVQMMRALQLEMHYSKREILEAYFNLAPYGFNIEGVGAASLIYFNKPASRLSLPEALTLSVMPQNPTKRVPGRFALTESRQKLYDRWLLTHPADIRLRAVMDLPVQMLSIKQLPFIAPHFVNRLLNDGQLKSKTVVSTLDGRLQRLLERMTRQFVVRHQGFGVYNAAVLLVDVRDRGIKAAVGSVDYFNSSIQGQVNGTTMKRSPGSTLKPFVYGLAFDEGLIHPNTVLKDVPHRFGAYNPENFDDDFMGPIKARDALVLSRNIPAIDLANQLKNRRLYQLLEAAEVGHLKPESYYGLALTLGGAELTMHELTGLYTMLVNEGMWHALRARQNAPMDKGTRLLSPEASFLVLDSLKESPRPDGFHAKGGHPPLSVSWKTGTSSGFRDAWSVGSFGPYVLAVWIGNFNNRGNPAFVGKNIAAPLFFELVNAIQQERGPLPVVAANPALLNLKKVAVCKASGLLPTRFCEDTEETWFIPGKSPIKTDTIYREVAIDSQTGLRTCHIDAHTRFEIYEFWPTDLLKVFKQAGIQRRTPPEYLPGCSPMGNIGLSPAIISPESGVRYIVRAKSTTTTTIPLTAVVDADVNTLYWFANNNYLGKTRADMPLLWQAAAGQYVVRAVDSHGLSDAREVVVQVEG